MTTQKLKYFVSFALYIIVAVLVIMLQSTGLAPLNIGTASAVLVLPLAVYAGFYFGEYAGAVFGLFIGAALDVFSSTFIYNTVALMVCGFVSGLLISRLFNRNFAAASVLNVSAAVLYFFVKWLVVYAFSDPAPMFIFVRFTLTSALYTGAIGVAMFFLLNLMLKWIPVGPTKK